MGEWMGGWVSALMEYEEWMDTGWMISVWVDDR